MSNEYLHGAYAGIKKSDESITNCTTCPVYIGTAPVNRVSGYNSDNKPILIRSGADAAVKLGYKDSDIFSEFTLSAAIYAHFKNNIEPIGPIICINVLNSVDHALIKTDQELQFINGVCYIDEHVIIDTLVITDKTKGTDYEATFDNKGRLKISLLGSNIDSTTSLTGSYKTLKTNKDIEVSDIIGDYDPDTGRSSGIKAVSDIYEDLNLVPSNMLVPYHSEPEVYSELLSLTNKLNNKFETIAFFDLENSSDIDNANKAIAFKENSNLYKDNEIKIFWPYQIMNNQEVPLSIVANVAKMQVDSSNGGFPCDTCSNKEIFSKGNTVNGNEIKISQEVGNELNKVGITTAIYNEGSFVVWGPHMGNYYFGLTDSPEEIFDVNIMCQKYLVNEFIRKFSKEIDQSLTRSDIDSIKIKEQNLLDTRIGNKQLLYAEVNFISSENSLNDVINGDFKISSLVTNKPLAKSITNYIQYTSEGLNSLLTEDEEESEN